MSKPEHKEKLLVASQLEALEQRVDKLEKALKSQSKASKGDK